MDEFKEARNKMDAILRDLHMHASFGEIRQFENELRNAEVFIVQLIAENLTLKESVLDLIRENQDIARETCSLYERMVFLTE